MPNEDIFSGIPSLDDTQGLEALINQQSLEAMGLDSNVPTALEQQPAQEPAQPQVPVQQDNGGVTYTSEQIAQIVARNQQLEAQLGQRQPQTQQPQPAQQPVYTDRQIEIVTELLRRGVSMDRIAQAMAKGRTNANTGVNNATLQRLQNIEQYLQQEQYNRELEAFTQKMLSFGEKFGLTENDLVHFGNVAEAKGIDVTKVTDLEAVFSGLFPDQYAIRKARAASRPTSQIYGGANIGETPRATSAKMEDAYVEAFLAKSMPNQYGIFNKK